MQIGIADPYKYEPYPEKQIKAAKYPFGKSLKVPKKKLNTNPG